MSRHALIVGGAKGIGAGIAGSLLDAGWKVTIAGRSTRNPDLEGRGAVFIAADVSISEQARGLARECGAVDALVVCAGPYHRRAFLKETDEGWRSMFANNLDPVFYLAQELLPGMKERGWGRIVTFSMAGAEKLIPKPMVAAHYVAKVGVLALTKTLSKAGARWGVTANCISPGFVSSGSADEGELSDIVKNIPAKRIGTVDDCVAAANYLLSDEAGYVTGSNILVSGGWGV